MWLCKDADTLGLKFATMWFCVPCHFCPFLCVSWISFSLLKTTGLKNSICFSLLMVFSVSVCKGYGSTYLALTSVNVTHSQGSVQASLQHEALTLYTFQVMFSCVSYGAAISIVIVQSEAGKSWRGRDSAVSTHIFYLNFSMSRSSYELEMFRNSSVFPGSADSAS